MQCIAINIILHTGSGMLMLTGCSYTGTHTSFAYTMILHTYVYIVKTFHKFSKCFDKPDETTTGYIGTPMVVLGLTIDY